jgi:hypothetical protein
MNKINVFIFIVINLASLVHVELCGQNSQKQKKYETSDNRYILMYELDSLFLHGHFIESIYAIRKDSTLSLAEGKYRIAANYAQMNMYDSAFCYLHDYIDNSTDDRLILIDRNWDILRKNTENWSYIISKIEKMYLLELDTGTNKELAIELFYMGVSDQKYRTHNADLHIYKDNALSNDIGIIEENIILGDRFEKILKEYGFPTISLVGRLGSMNAFLLLQHSLYIDKYYFLVKKAYQSKDIEAIYYAMITDRWLMRRNKKQLYGTQFIKSDKSQKKFPGKSVLWPVKDFKNVNQRRKEMGFLTTVEENTEYGGNRYIPKEYYYGKGRVRWVF